MGLPVNPKRGSLVVDGIDLMSSRYMIQNLGVLHGLGQIRGGDRIIPGVAGVTPLRRRRTGTRHDLNLFVCGDDDGDGAVFADAQAGLTSNLNVLLNDVADESLTPITRTAVWTPWGDTAKTFPIVVEGFEIGDPINPSTVRTVLSILLPNGRP